MIGKVLGLVAALLPVPANAVVLFQSIPDLSAPPAASWCSACAGFGQAFDEFTLSADAAIRTALFNVQSDYFFPAAITVEIFNLDNDGLPGGLLFSQTFSPSQFGVKHAINNFNTVAINPTGLLLPAASYDISFYNPTNLGVPSYIGGSGKLYLAGADIRPKQSLGFVLDDIAFNIPEPSTWAMMLIGLTGMAILSRFTAAARRAIRSH